MTVEAALTAIKLAGLSVIMASEFKPDYWVVNLARDRKVESKKWVTGRGKTFGSALNDAISKVTRQAAKPAASPFEDLLG